MKLSRSVFLRRLAVMLLTVPVAKAEARVAPIKLSELIKTSDYIVLARVERVKRHNGIQIARAVPQTMYKGRESLPTFYFIAEKT